MADTNAFALWNASNTVAPRNSSENLRATAQVTDLKSKRGRKSAGSYRCLAK